ncbi:replication restart helicase PriA [Desulfovulcanus sp.]
MTNYELRAWTVYLLSPPYSTLTYQLPKYFPEHIWRMGQRVLVPLGKKNSLRLGVLARKEKTLLSSEQLKNIYWPLEEDLLTPDYLSMVEDLANRQMVSPGRILAQVLPRSLKVLPKKFNLADENKDLSIRDVFEDECLCQNLSKDWLAGKLSFVRAKVQSDTQFVNIIKDPPWPIMPNAKVQWEVMDFLWENGPIPKSVLRKVFGPNIYAVLKRLSQKGLISFHSDRSLEVKKATDLPKNISFCSCRYSLTQEQDLAFKYLNDLLQRKTHEVALVHGITGSGKTLVYLELAKQTLKKGRSVLILGPEIALVWQLFNQAQEVLGPEDLFIHYGTKSAKEKEDLFFKLNKKDEPFVLVGTRSSLFLPLKNLGLIIVDEEHAESYKQEQNFIYQAKEIAYYLARRQKALLVLGSATPDIKTYFAAEKKQIHKVELKRRVGQSVLPAVHLVNLIASPAQFGPLSSVSYERLMEVLDKGEQAVILHNRRGYAPILYCEQCQEIAKCTHCQVSLTYHKVRQRLVCHYCGLSIPFPIICSHCGSCSFLPLGGGTEKLEEFLVQNLPDRVKVLRLDRDSTRRKGSMEEILDKFAKGHAQILVGTQMLSKGHNFPNVTLGIIIDGDLGLGLPDYRASERIFQLLIQMAGRAGRGDKPGEVYIQTRNPDHYCWQYILNNDYDGFYIQEIKRREKFAYPPFVKLALIRLSFPAGWKEKENFLVKLKVITQELARSLKINVLGPAPAPLQMLKGRERYQCLLKASNWLDIKKFYALIEKRIGQNKKIRLSLDLDPVSML